jgi:hypothetical protein
MQSYFWVFESGFWNEGLRGMVFWPVTECSNAGGEEYWYFEGGVGGEGNEV